MAKKKTDKKKPTIKTAIVKASDYDLDDKRAGEIQASFGPMVVERKLLAKEYATIKKLPVDAAVCKRAGTLRKALVKVRTGIDNVHRTQKHLFLMAGRFVDAWKNAETLPVTQMEEKLRGIEKHFENIELLRINTILVARVEELGKYGVVDELCPAGLGEMDDVVWQSYLFGIKESNRQQKAEEAKAEKERIAKEKADAEQLELVRLENAKLKKEAEGRAKVEARERKTREVKEAKERKKREDAEAKVQAELKAERDAADAKLKAERKERERADKARIAKENKEAKARELANNKAAAKLQAERAERERLEQEKEDREEAERIEREEKETREKDTAHRKTVNNAIVNALMATEPRLARPACMKIVKAMVKGEIPNVSVNY